MLIIRKARETGLAAAMTLAVMTMTFVGGISGVSAAPGVQGQASIQISSPVGEGLVQLVDGRGRERDWRRDGRRDGHREHGYHDRGHGHHWGRLDVREIRRSLRHQGYRHIRILGERGRVYIASATGWRGMPLRLVVDSQSGAVISREPIGRSHHWDYRW